MIYMLKRNVTLLNFQDARNISEINRYSSQKKKNLSKLSLSENENKDLKNFTSIPIENLSIEDKIYFQKLFILNSIYEHINKGFYIAEFVLPFPLITSVKDWVSAKGYCMCPTPVDYSYYYVDNKGYLRWHQAEALDPTVVCNYRILW